MLVKCVLVCKNLEFCTKRGQKIRHPSSEILPSEFIFSVFSLHVLQSSSQHWLCCFWPQRCWLTTSRQQRLRLHQTPLWPHGSSTVSILCQLCITMVSERKLTGLNICGKRVHLGPNDARQHQWKEHPSLLKPSVSDTSEPPCFMVKCDDSLSVCRQSGGTSGAALVQPLWRQTCELL